MADFKGITESFIIKQRHEFQKQLFWPNLKNGPFNKFEDPVCCVKFCQTSPNFAMASGFQVEIRDPSAGNAVLKSFHRFKSPVRSLAYRDGSLLAVGEASGQASVYSVSMRSELRKMPGHASAVTGMAFLAGGPGDGNPRLVTCAEDGRCLLWNVADSQGQPLTEFHLSASDAAAAPAPAGAADAYKATALDTSQTDCNLVACGLSDGRAALLDPRQPRPALWIPGTQPVSALRLAPGGNALYLAGDCWVRAVSLHQAGRQIAAYRRHHKLVTDLAVGRGALLSCGLDGLVKVTDLLTFEEVHKYEYPNCGLLCMALAPAASAGADDAADASCLALGSSDRWLLTRMFEDPTAAAALAKSAAISDDPYLKAVRASRVMPARKEDSVDCVRQPPRRRLDDVDKLLKAFRHSDALSRAIDRGHFRAKPHRAAALVRELTRRGALAAALAGRGDAQVARLVKFVLHSLGGRELGLDALALAWDLVDIYAGELHRRPCLRGLFERLRAVLAREISLGREIMTSLGRIDLVLSAASAGAAGGFAL